MPDPVAICLSASVLYFWGCFYVTLCGSQASGGVGCRCGAVLLQGTICKGKNVVRPPPPGRLRLMQGRSASTVLVGCT